MGDRVDLGRQKLGQGRALGQDALVGLADLVVGPVPGLDPQDTQQGLEERRPVLRDAPTLVPTVRKGPELR